MRKLFFVLTVLLSISASAQVRWGAVAGGGASNLNAMDLVSSSRLININAGLIADIKVSGNVHLLAELLYAPMGYENSNLDAIDNSGNNVGKIEMHRVNYINVPFYISYKAKLQNFIFNAGTGLFFSLQAGDKLQILNGDSYRSGTVFPSGVSDINSILTGFGFQIGAEWSSIFLLVNFQQSFNSIYEPRSPSETKWQINNFGVNLGYYFKKPKK
jgi:hypothetical protein